MTEYPRIIAIFREAVQDKSSLFEIRNQPNVNNVWEKR